MLLKVANIRRIGRRVNWFSVPEYVFCEIKVYGAAKPIWVWSGGWRCRLTSPVITFAHVEAKYMVYYISFGNTRAISTNSCLDALPTSVYSVTGCCLLEFVLRTC